MTEFTEVSIHVNQSGAGVLSVALGGAVSPIWRHIEAFVLSRDFEHKGTANKLNLSWSDTLTVIREFGTRTSQANYNFRFAPTEAASEHLSKFVKQIRAVRRFRDGEVQDALCTSEIKNKLREAGFTRRELKPFQLRDLSHLLKLPNGANFSVPGAGKTTVTFALHVLTRQPGRHFIIIAPKAAFQAWKDVVGACIDPKVSPENAESFIVLSRNEKQTARALSSGATRFVISYDLALRQQSTLANHMATHPTHLVLDESHRMKAGLTSKRGTFLLGVATLPVRRDILSGTPMPQSASDIESQLEFLWPGHGLGREIAFGAPPRSVLGRLYVRTTKMELGLPKPNRYFRPVGMGDGQLALYSIVRDEFLRNFAKSAIKDLNETQILRARRSVMRLLQLSACPMLALNAMANDDVKISSSIFDAVIEEGHSPKMRAVMKHARELASIGQKVVIWTIFTGTIHRLDSALADLNPVYIHGGVHSGPEDNEATREGRIRRFHEDSNCSVLIANPAATGEGINLHTVCHNAIYLDRSYVSTHYLQSIDRIHRLGLPEDQETNIYIYGSRAPAEIGSVDMSVGRRLARKIRKLHELLNDTDLHEIACDEEHADTSIDYDVGIEDIVDLISELENKSLNPFDELT